MIKNNKRQTAANGFYLRMIYCIAVWLGTTNKDKNKAR